MIPRLRPYLGSEELSALLRIEGGRVCAFEDAFARTFAAQHALAFPYGRSALWAFFKAVELENAEIILPAYTCVVVAHAVLLSGNIPRFVDITLTDYNMQLDQVEQAINQRTQAVVATHLFGYPLDIVRLQAIVQAAERRFGHKIWVIQDCAHSFGARWQGQLVCSAGDVALFGLNISKLMTAIFGGMLTTNDSALAERLRTWRDQHLHPASLGREIRRLLYLLAVYGAFSQTAYDLVYWLQERTPLLNPLTKAYHLDEKVHFPPDYTEQMGNVEAQVGLAQLGKYAQIVQKRVEYASYYHKHLQEAPGWVKPPWVEGATYSHYVVRVPNRDHLLAVMARRGVQLGQLIEYSVPHMAAYQRFAAGEAFPNSWLCSQSMINLPVHGWLSQQQQRRVVEQLNAQIHAGHWQ
jgi:dTDP-4-amino-4,6-dideoxygalactose transaminase